MQITDYTRMEQLFILAIQEVISQSGADLREPDCTLLLSTTKGNIDLLSELPADSPVFLWKMAERIGDFFGATNQVEVISNACISGVSALIVAKRWIESGRYKRVTPLPTIRYTTGWIKSGRSLWSCSFRNSRKRESYYSLRRSNQQ